MYIYKCGIFHDYTGIEFAPGRQVQYSKKFSMERMWQRETEMDPKEFRFDMAPIKLPLV